MTRKDIDEGNLDGTENKASEHIAKKLAGFRQEVDIGREQRGVRGLQRASSEILNPLTLSMAPL